jgi:CDGSH-type Zn-finger protein
VTTIIGIADNIPCWQRAPLSSARCEKLAGVEQDERLRATRVRAPGAPSLQRATAALQDLSRQAVADNRGRLEARHTEFVTLLKGLPRTIQSARNGAYLLTTVETVTDWLGVPLDPTPRAALCRCGASAIKPRCDGSHARVSLEDAKSDRRVPDRLDEYRGCGMSIADNRGTCAHLGLCTDPAPTVLRPDKEPFVASAGGRIDETLRAARDRPSGALSAPMGSDDPVGASDSEREPAIEVSKDGPHRVTGRVELSATTATRTPATTEPRSSTTACAGAAIHRTGRSAAARTGTQTSAIPRPRRRPSTGSTWPAPPRMTDPSRDDRANQQNKENS